MTTKDTGDNDSGFRIDEHGVPVLETPIEKIERQQREAKERDRLYKDRQLDLEETQVKINTRIGWFTGLLVLASIITGGITLYQAHTSKIAAEAAKSAADTAAATLKEMQTGEGSRDTHTLAEQAVKQSEQTTALAKAAERQADALKSSFEEEARPYLGIDVVGVEFTPQPFNPADANQMRLLHLSAAASLRNSGSVPANNVTFGWRVFIDGIEQEVTSVQHADTALNPNALVGLRAGFSQPKSGMIILRRVPFVAYLTYSYTWRKGKFKEHHCNKEVFSKTTNTFLDVGETCYETDPARPLGELPPDKR